MLFTVSCQWIRSHIISILKWTSSASLTPQRASYHICYAVFETSESDNKSHWGETKAQSIVFDTKRQFSHVTSSERRCQGCPGSSRKMAARGSSHGGIPPASFYSKNSEYFTLVLHFAIFFLRKVCATKIMSLLLFLTPIHLLTFQISVYHFWYSGPSLMAQFSYHFW